MTNLNEAQSVATDELNDASLRLVVGGIVIAPDIVSPRDTVVVHDIVVHDGR